jgi:hypothetical protein
MFILGLFWGVKIPMAAGLAIGRTPDGAIWAFCHYLHAFPLMPRGISGALAARFLLREDIS